MCRHVPLPSNHIDEFGVRIYGPMQRKLNILPENNNGTTIICLHLIWYRFSLIVRANYFARLIILMQLLSMPSVPYFILYSENSHLEKNIKVWISRTVFFEQIQCCIASYIACKLKFQHIRIPTKHTWMISSSPQIITFSHSMAFWGGNENHLSFHWFHFPTFTTVEPYSDFFFVCVSSMGQSNASFVLFSTHSTICILPFSWRWLLYSASVRSTQKQSTFAFEIIVMN